MSKQRRRARSDTEILGAVDLGSNSFHMVAARFSHGQLVVMDRLRETVRLAAGLNRRNRLDRASQRRALECLARFGERLRNMRAGRVRVVGTNALRKARSTERFRQQAGRLLGHPVEVISGIEEARLIYLGVSRSLAKVRIANPLARDAWLERGRRLIDALAAQTGAQDQLLYMQVTRGVL